MDVSDLKRRVSRHFFDLVDEDANPLVVALALQDNSSVGLQHYGSEFRELHEELRQALRLRVENSYQGFNESVGVYRQVVASLKSSHEGIQLTKTELEKLHELFGNHKPMLKTLHEKSIRYKRKLEILADLETLQQLPSIYESNVAKRHFSAARLQLSHALETINSRNLLGQPSVKPLLMYVQTQQTELVAKLVDEIHSTIYLQSPYSHNRLEKDDTDFKEFLEALPKLPEPVLDSPESNCFSYLAMLIQNLADLQSLGVSLDGLQNKVSTELEKLCKQTSIEVINELKLTPENIKEVAEGQTLLEQFRYIDQTALDTLSRSLYAKLTKFLEAQRAISEISSQYGAMYNFEAVCVKTVDIIRSFLKSYIGGNADATRLRKRDRENGNTLQRARPRAGSDGGASRTSRSRHTGPVFEFGPGDEDSKGLRDFETLRQALKSSIPGLLADDPHNMFAETHQQERLEVVAPPHILNIRPLLEPSAAFFTNIRMIAVSEETKHIFDTFLDTFLREEFVPQLKNAFNEAIVDIAEDEYALNETQNWRALSQLPIVNCAGQFAETVGLLTQLLDTGSSYREDYAVMLVHLVSRISTYFRSQLENVFKLNSLSVASSSNGTNNSAANSRHFKVWDFVTNQKGLLDTLMANYRNQESNLRVNKEFQIYFERRQTPRSPKPRITIADLLDIRTFKQATLLITSVRWFVLRMRKMRQVASVDATKNNESNSLHVRRRWSLLDSSFTTSGTQRGATQTSSEIASIMNATAMLAGESLSNFDGIISWLEDHAFKALCALRVDTFLRIVYYFDQMINTRDFHSSNRGEERDPVVDRLQQELSVISQVFDSNLLNTDNRFLLSGIATFMNEMFILEGENISDMNEAGQNQILTNIFALQQMLTSIVADPREVDFSRATGFYELFRLNPTLIIEKAREGETDLGPEDLKLLLQIRHRNASGLSTSHAFGTLSTHLSQLNGIFNGTAPMTHNSSQQTDAQKSQATVSDGPAAASVLPLRSRAFEKATEKNPQSSQHSKKSDAQLEAEAVAKRLREDRAKQLAEKRLQMDHEAQSVQQAANLREERERLKSRSQESLQFTQAQQPEHRETPRTYYDAHGATAPSQASAEAVVSERNSSLTAAAPSAGAAKSPLLNHRPRYEAHHQKSAFEKAEEDQKAQIQQVEKAQQIRTRYAQEAEAQRAQQIREQQADQMRQQQQARNLHKTQLQQAQASQESRLKQSRVEEEDQPQTQQLQKRPSQPLLRESRSTQTLPRVRVNTSLPYRESSKSPHTPDQPTSKGPARTPSERALEAAQKVRIRQIPQPSRRPF